MLRMAGLLFVAAVIVFALSTPEAAGRRATAVTGLWLDQPLTNWNRPDGRTPSPPEPADIPDIAAPAVCNERLRRPVTAAERTLVKRGWKLFGAAQTFDATQVILATTGWDGMCRPVGYQAFVYWDGRYAGTLAPVAMNARTDGALADVTLVTPTELVAEFDRYAAGDPACCPSRRAVVTYTLHHDDLPVVVATNVRHRPACPDAGSEPPANPEPPTDTTLSGRRWTLTKLEGKPVNTAEPFLEFDASTLRVTGSDGCNRFAGRYDIRGDRIKFFQLAGTKRACLDEAVRKLEMRFNRALPKVNRFVVRDNQLLLYNGRQLLMTLTAK
ncbi:MAG: META domain-containing protein [Chloracidobacterium sp.]|nr:META domain-containing protein [Chloracidobacterium sp.]MDW8218314.1 META domain-containing protein [Acidobacteriota bacterium]